MDTLHANQFSVEFEAAVLSPPESEPPVRRNYRIGWYVQSTDVNSASVRYRCFHFARVLSPAFESLYFSSLADLQNAISSLDAVVIVKRLDRSVLELVASARLFQTPVFLDLCDDLIADSYSKNDLGINLIHFLGIAGSLAGVTAPSADMADRIAAYASDHGLKALPVHVVPDIAETWDIYRATCKSVTGNDPGTLASRRSGKASGKKVVWFGNYGASHSNFGIFSLKRALKPLRTVSRDIPLELVIVSNSEPVYRGLVHNCGFPTRYVSWSPQAVYSELASADAALLTTGDDDFCTIKSSNRVLQALAMNVPVIAGKGSSVSEFEDVIFSGPLEDALRLCLGPAAGRAVPPRMEASRCILARYAPDRLGKIWASLLENAIAKAGRKPKATHHPRILTVIEPGDSSKVAAKLFSTFRSTPQLEHRVVVSTDLLESDPEFTSVLIKAPAVPRFFSGKLNGPRSLLLGCSALVVERPGAPAAKQLSEFAAQLNVPVIASEEAAAGSLERFARAPAITPPAASTVRAGPFEERLNADGSVDWSFIVHENARGWILDAICREIGSRQPTSWKVTYHPEPAPAAKTYFFSHYLLLQNWLDRDPARLANAKVLVWYTHPREEDPVSVKRLLLAFDHVTKVIFACESNRQVWLERGLPEEKTAVVLGAADPALFRYHERGDGAVGLSSSFYERKNPDCLLEIVKLLPHRQFVLLGRKWNQYALFEEMKALPNFTYKSAPYSEYPDIYATFDVFLSMSSLEGGPIPLVEAMMSNAVPVASRTGFAPDLIRHGENGFIFDLDASPSTIAKMIEAAYALQGDVRATVEAFDWDRFSAEVVKLAG